MEDSFNVVLSLRAPPRKKKYHVETGRVAPPLLPSEIPKLKPSPEIGKSPEPIFPPLKPPHSIWHPKSARFQFSMLLLLIFMGNTLIQVTMSTAIVCMVNNTAMSQKSAWQQNETNETDSNATVGTTSPRPSRRQSCDEQDVNEEDSQYDGALLWTSQDKGWVIASLYLGGLLTAIPSGFLAERISPKKILTVSLGIGVLGTFLTPVTARRLSPCCGVWPTCLLRGVMGLGGAAIAPTIRAICVRWIPPTERSSVLAVYTTGANIAVMIALPFNAYMCRVKDAFFDGWVAIFHATGLVIIPMLVAWVFFASDTPQTYRWMKKDELDFIEASLAEQHLSKTKLTCGSVPWKGMLSSVPMLVNMFANFAFSTIITIVQSFSPMYFKQALHFKLEDNGLLSALPFLFGWLGLMISSLTADRLRASKLLGPTWVCKIYNSIGTFGATIPLMVAAYMDCNTAGIAVAMFTMATFVNAFQFPGFVTSLVFIAPSYTGIVNALARFFGQIGSGLAPYLVGKLTPKGTSQEWQHVFWYASSVTMVAGLLFLAFGSAEIQPWAKMLGESTATASKQTSTSTKKQENEDKKRKT